MRRIFISIFLLAAGGVLVGCSYDQVGCTNGCGYTPTTYVATTTTTTYVPTTTYVATTRYMPTIRYVSSPSYYTPTTTCCPTCNRCGAAYTGYGSGAEYGYDHNNNTWY